MRKIIVLSIALMLAVMTGCASKEAREAPEPVFIEVSVKAMTYNIHGGRGSKTDSVPAVEGLERVAKIVESAAPDLLLIQEIERGAKRSGYIDEIEWLKNRLEYPHVLFAPAFKKESWEYGVAIFSQYPIIGPSGKHMLYQVNPKSEQRVLLETTVSVKSIPLTVFCTHLGLTREERTKQIEEISVILSECPHDFIIGGDFNAVPESVEMKLLHDAFTDVLTEVETPADQRLTYPSGEEAKKSIDTFFVSSEVSVSTADVVIDRIDASDHNAVIVELVVSNQ